MNSRVNTKCPLCQSDAKTLWPKLNVCKCQSCNLLFRYPASTVEALDVLYQTSWGNPNNHTDETGATSPELARDYIGELAKSLGRKDLKGLRVLDYGAGRGAILKVLRDSGVDAFGVEPFGCEFLQQNGYKAFHSLDDLPKGIIFDGVVSLDVVEHLQVPWDDCHKLRDYLAVHGWLYLSTPNVSGINAHYYQSNWREFHNRGHLFFFTPATLEHTLKKSGYKNLRRLQWFINYHKGPAVAILHWLFQFTKIDGELRYLAFE